MKPTVGRIVHYAPPQDCKGKTTPDFYAAIITQVSHEVKGVPGDDGSDIPETIELATFGPNSLYFQHKVSYSETLEAGKWTWPPKS